MRHATQRGLNSTRCWGRWLGPVPLFCVPPHHGTCLNPIDLAGGHKMTDDEIREALRLDFEQTADWRRSKAAEYPEDSRNLEAAALLDKLAASVETVAPDLLDAYGSLWDDYMNSRSTAKCSDRSVSIRGPKQQRTLSWRASPTGPCERKVRERRRRGRLPRRRLGVPSCCQSRILPSIGNDRQTATRSPMTLRSSIPPPTR